MTGDSKVTGGGQQGDRRDSKVTGGDRKVTGRGQQGDRRGTAR